MTNRMEVNAKPSECQLSGEHQKWLDSAQYDAADPKLHLAAKLRCNAVGAPCETHGNARVVSPRTVVTPVGPYVMPYVQITFG